MVMGTSDGDQYVAQHAAMLDTGKELSGARVAAQRDSCFEVLQPSSAVFVCTYFKREQIEFLALAAFQSKRTAAVLEASVPFKSDQLCLTLFETQKRLRFSNSTLPLT